MTETLEANEKINVTNEADKQKSAKLASLKKCFILFQNKLLSFCVYFFCFIFFPVYLIYSSLTFYFETNTDNLRQLKLSQMNDAMVYLEKYSSNKRYFHFLFNKIAENAQKSDNPIEYLKKNIDNIKQKYPNKFQFIVWNENGKIIKELCDKTSYSYVMNKLYDALFKVSKEVKNNPSIRVSNLDIVKDNLGIFQKFLGRIFIPENLKYPLYNRLNSGPFLTELGQDLSNVWFSINDKISFLCFISNDLLNDFTGLNKISEYLTTNNSDIICGFSVSSNFEKPVSKFPKRYETDLTMALINFENAGDSVFENEHAIVRMSMPEPSVRTFCYLHKTDDSWNYEYKRDLWLGILVSILFALYAIGGFWFLYKRHFFSIRWKLTALFLLANLSPIAVLGFIAKGYLESKRLSLKNDIVSELEKSLREFDSNYTSLLDSYSYRINSVVNDVSVTIGNGAIHDSEINKLIGLYDTFKASDIYLIASTTLLNSKTNIVKYKRDESKADINLNFMSNLGDAILCFANQKPVKSYDTDIFSDMFKPENAEIIRSYLKTINSVVEFNFGNYYRIFYSNSFGDKDNYNNNYFLLMFWEKETFQNIFIKENYKTFFNSFPDVEFFIKSNLSDYYYGSDKIKKVVNQLLDRNLGMTEKKSGYINIDGKRFIFVTLVGSNLKDWTLLAVKSEDSINKKINLIIVQSIVGAFVSLLLTILIGHMLSLQFLKPIHNLGEAALAIGDRNFSYRVPIGDKDEFGHLNIVFNRVIEGLGDFEVARIVQESLFPGNHFDVGNFKIFGRSVVMTTLGGDYYDCFKINDEYQGIIIGDVAGHGIPAGLMMAMAKSSVLTASEETKLDPAALTTRLHKMFFAIKNERLKRMMTFQYFVLRLSDGHFRYTNAGHCFPIIVDSKAKTATFMDYIATPLGIGPRCRCKNQEFDLAEGQSLILYTDGIVEANNSEGEQYGYDRYQACLPEFYDSNPETFYYNLYNKVYKQWSPKPDDDLTLILVNRV